MNTHQPAPNSVYPTDSVSVNSDQSLSHPTPKEQFIAAAAHIAEASDALTAAIDAGVELFDYVIRYKDAARHLRMAQIQIQTLNGAQVLRAVQRGVFPIRTFPRPNSALLPAGGGADR